MGNFRIGRVLGIPIELNLSWFVIFFLIFWSLTFYLFPTLVPRLSQSAYWVMGGSTTLLFFASLLFHELSHSYVSQRYGMKVDRIVLFLFGGVSETHQDMVSAKSEFWVALAGPLSSLVLGFGFLVLALLPLPIPVVRIAQWLSLINFVLGIFNLLPGFPLDGGRVLRAIIWHFTGNQRKATRIASRIGQMMAGLLMAWGVYRLFTGSVFGGMWIFFLGWLLLSAASNEYSELVLRQVLGRVSVRELMSDGVKTLDPSMTIEQAVQDYFLRFPYGGYPVVDEHGLRGIVTFGQIREVPREEWGQRRIQEILQPLKREEALAPAEDVATALQKFRATDLGRLPVYEGEQLVGILSQSDVVRWLNAHPELSEEL